MNLLTWAAKTATERADAIRAAEHLSLDCRDQVHGACDGCDCTDGDHQPGTHGGGV